MNSSQPYTTEEPGQARPIPRANVHVSPAAPSPGLTVGDFYYVIFRHKWRIILCSILGITAAAAVFVLNPPPFQSEAKLFIRYVVVGGGAGAVRGDESHVKTPDQGGETIMDSEQEILSSLDLARQVAQVVGPEKILAKFGGSNDLGLAASVVQQGLIVDVPPRSSVIRIVYSNPDPRIVQPVLREVINQYLKMHLAIHQAVGIVGDFMAQETDQLRAALAQTDEELRKARAKAGVTSLDDTKKTYSDQMARVRMDIYAAQAELAERTSMFQELTKRANPSASPITNAGETPVPQDKVNEFRSLSTRLELLRKREQDLLEQFTPQSDRVVNMHAMITDTEAARQKILAEYPRLTPSPLAAPAGSPAYNVDFGAMSAQLTALQSKIAVLNSQYEQLKAEAGKIDEVSGTIEELKRRKDLQEANYRYYSATLEQNRINEALGAGKVSNISEIQTPSPPSADRRKTAKLVGGILFAGFGLGLAWSFFIELYLDRSVRRPVDVERILSLPLFLSIPVLNRRERKRLANVRETLALSAGESSLAVGQASPGGKLSNGYLLYSFHETLRDRLIGYFESRGLTHKPKLVAVTGLGHGSGVTTTASGLASSLSQTGEGNVLLVDMTAGQGSAQHFYRGEKVCGLEEILSSAEAGSKNRGGVAQVQDHLYVVGEEPGEDKLSRILPQRFTKLVPKLKASNFDYIIFDMPPVSQISITPRLAGFMDMVLLVIESEKTDRELVQRATSLLAQSKAHVGAVLNKTKTYVPAALHQDYLGNS